MAVSFVVPPSWFANLRPINRFEMSIAAPFEYLPDLANRPERAVSQPSWR
jgi:hypothetical protein